MATVTDTLLRSSPSPVGETDTVAQPAQVLEPVPSAPTASAPSSSASAALAADSDITEFHEITITVTPFPIPQSEHTKLLPPHPLQPLDDLVGGKDSGFLTRIFSTKGWTRTTTKHDGEIETATYRGRRIPVSEIDDLVLRLNLTRVLSLRLDCTPELPSFPQHLLETLYIPGLRVLHLEQPLPLAAVPATANFIRGQPGRHLECITLNRLRLDEEAVTSLVDGLLRAGVKYIGYRFQRGGPGLEIDLDPGRRASAERARRGSTSSSVIEVRRLSRDSGLDVPGPSTKWIVP